MSQRTSYVASLAPSGRFPAPATRAPHASALLRERSTPTLLAFLASLYLCSVPMFSSWKEEVSWIPQVIGVGVGVAWLIFGALFGGRGVDWPRPILLYIAWAIWGATGLMVTLDHTYFRTQWFSVVKVALMAYVMSQCIRSRADLLTCLTMISLASVVVFATGADAIASATAFSGMRETVGARAEGTLLSNANDLGVFGMVVLLSSVTALWAFRNKLFKFLCVATAPVALYLIAASGSRMAMVGVMIAGAGTYFFHLRKIGGHGVERKVAMLLIGVMLAGGSVYYVSKNPFFFRLRAAFADKGAVEEQPRTQYFFRGIKAAAENPVFGLGIGGFALHGLGGHGAKSHYSHSTVTETLSCTGLPGFCLYFGAQLALFNLIRKMRKAPLPKHDLSTVNMIMVAFWTFLLMSVVSVMFSDRLIIPLLGAFSGYLTALKKQYFVAPRAAGGFVR